MTLFHAGQVYSQRAGQDVEVWQQKNPITGISDQGAHYAMSLFGDRSEVTNVKNTTSYEAVIFHQHNNVWKTTNLLRSGDSGSNINGMPYTGIWELYTDPLTYPPQTITIDVSWELKL